MKDIHEVFIISQISVIGSCAPKLLMSNGLVLIF